MAEFGQVCLALALALSLLSLAAGILGAGAGSSGGSQGGQSWRDRRVSPPVSPWLVGALVAGLAVAVHLGGLHPGEWAYGLGVVGIAGVTLFTLWSWRGDARLVDMAVRGIHVSSVALTLAIVVLGVAFYLDDFRIEYVSGHSSLDQPRIFAVTAIWGGMEGSLLLWAWFVALFASGVIIQNRWRYPEFVPWVTATFAAVNIFFLGVINFHSNPFSVVSTAVPLDGRGLNPLLQNPGMVIHPPMLYAGFVGTTVAFAFAMGGLASGRLDDTWIRASRKWTVATWAVLGIGILLGGWWAYEELGWGGYWAWDPVENASFMPWLMGTAFLHSAIIQEKRNTLKVWNMVLAFLTFWLAVFGTFLTRSGFVQSVHTFAQSDIGWWFLGFLAIVGVIFFWGLAVRYAGLRDGPRLDAILSKESSFLFNNWLFAAACFVILLGTVGEPVSRALTGISTTFRAPYYNEIEIPIFLGVLFLAGVGPMISWRRATRANLKRNFMIPMGIACVGGGGLAVAGVSAGILDLGDRAHVYALITAFLSIFVVATVLFEYSRGVRARMRAHGEGMFTALGGLVARNRRRYGGYVVHLGMTAIFLGVAGSAFNLEAEALLEEGQSLYVGDYEVRYLRSLETPGPGYTAKRVEAALFRDGEPLVIMLPERRAYTRQGQPTTEVSIYSRFLEDVYLVPAGWTDNPREAILKVYMNPLVSWLWGGGLILLLGTCISLWPDRRVARGPRRSTSQMSAMESQELRNA